MKKSYLFGMMAATMFFASSCQNDLLESNSGETSMVSFNLGTPGITSRTFSDGTLATKLQYAVYDANGNYLEDLTKTDATINGRATVDLQLTTGNTYSVIFWAANDNAPYEVNFEEKTMTVNYDGALSNDETRDAFYARHTFTVTGNQTENVVLTRPFAQLNIGANDYLASENAGYKVIMSSVKVPVYTTLNLFDGTVGGQAEQTFNLAAIPANETFPVDGYDYLSMNYLLVGADQETVEVEFGYSDGTTPKSRTVGFVPVQRNHRTNIYGQLFTSDVDVNVEINPAYDESDNNVGFNAPSIAMNIEDLKKYLADASVKTIDLGADINETVVMVSNKTINGLGHKVKAINLNGADNVTLKNIVFDAANAVYGYDGAGTKKDYAFSNIITGDNVNKPNKGAHNLVIDGCTFTGTFANPGAAIAFTDQKRGEGGSGNITIKNCVFDNSNANYVIYGHYTGDSMNGHGNFVIEGNTFKTSCYAGPIYLGRYASSTPVVVKDNTFETVSSLEYAVYVQDHSDYGVSIAASGNTFAE